MSEYRCTVCGSRLVRLGLHWQCSKCDNPQVPTEPSTTPPVVEPTPDAVAAFEMAACSVERGEQPSTQRR